MLPTTREWEDVVYLDVWVALPEGEHEAAARAGERLVVALGDDHRAADHGHAQVVIEPVAHHSMYPSSSSTSSMTSGCSLSISVSGSMLSTSGVFCPWYAIEIFPSTSRT